jgi:hypothetical protein
MSYPKPQSAGCFSNSKLCRTSDSCPELVIHTCKTRDEHERSGQRQKLSRAAESANRECGLTAAIGVRCSGELLNHGIGFSNLVTIRTTTCFSGMINAGHCMMDQDALTLLAWIWTHNPVIIVLLLGLPILFLLIVIDTHRHRKKENRRRDMGNRHPF